MIRTLRPLVGLVTGSARDLAPIVLVVAFFQVVVLRQPLPNLAGTLVGLFLVMLGLGLFIRGLDMALFPVGESLAGAFARKGSVFWLLTFAFGLGFGTTVAEPALIAVTAEAAEVMSGAGAIAADQDTQDDFALALRYTVAVSVGTAIVIGVWRILKGWPIHWLIISGYVLVVALTTVAPEEIVGIGAAGHGPRRGARHRDPRPQSHGRRFRSDRLCQPDPDHFCLDFRHRGLSRWRRAGSRLWRRP